MLFVEVVAGMLSLKMKRYSGEFRRVYMQSEEGPR